MLSAPVASSDCASRSSYRVISRAARARRRATVVITVTITPAASIAARIRMDGRISLHSPPRSPVIVPARTTSNAKNNSVEASAQTARHAITPATAARGGMAADLRTRPRCPRASIARRGRWVCFALGIEGLAAWRAVDPVGARRR
jgi:hypothetical protein